MKKKVYIETSIPSAYFDVRTNSISIARKELIMEDPLIDDIREIRIQISNKFNNDPISLINYYIEKQKEHSNRLLISEYETEEGAINN